MEFFSQLIGFYLFVGLVWFGVRTWYRNIYMPSKHPEKWAEMRKLDAERKERRASVGGGLAMKALELWLKKK